MCWRVETGTKIPVKEAAWVPGSVDHKIKMRNNMSEAMMVANIIDRE